jgi:chromate transporter
VDGIALGQVTPGPVFITATFIGYKVWGILGGLVATLAVFMPSLIAIIALADLHAKVKKAKIVQVIIRGFLSGFIGLLVAVALQFGLKSLISWQAWLICLVTIIWMMFLKKNAVWAIVGTMVFSLLFIK